MKRLLCLLAVGAISVPALSQIEYWGSSRGLGGAPHVIYGFDAAGTWTLDEPQQVAGAQSSAWGYRDGAFDGTYTYWGWETGVARHNADGSGGTQIISGGGPNGMWRALAYDPTGDGGNGSLWTCSWGTRLVEVDMAGNQLNWYPNNYAWSLYGLAYDDSDGNLWAHHSDPGEDFPAEIFKIDTSNGNIIPGTRFYSHFNWPGGTIPGNFAIQGGLSTQDGTGLVVAILQGNGDAAAMIDPVAQALAGPMSPNPNEWQAQTSNNGHLGVAIISAGGGPDLCGDANCDTSFNGADIDPFFLALGNPAQWQAIYGSGGLGCDLVETCDINYDGAVNGADIDPFFAALGAGACPPPPGPVPPPRKPTPAVPATNSELPAEDAP